jgi:crossover junction endodeoxyribonuclease RuvC
LSQRTLEFHNFFKTIIAEKGVTHVSLETSFLGKNPQTFLKLGYLRGILYLLAAQNKLEIAEFAPREVKQAIVGSGSAQKEEVALMLMRMFPQLQQYAASLRNDVTDAIAIGICGMCLFS